MVPVSLVVRSRVIQGMRAGAALWRWSSASSGVSASWPMHQAGQSAVGSRQSVGCTPQRGLLMLPSHSPLFPFDVWWDCQGESEAHR